MDSNVKEKMKNTQSTEEYLRLARKYVFSQIIISDDLRIIVETKKDKTITSERIIELNPYENETERSIWFNGFEQALEFAKIKIQPYKIPNSE
jgi:hypothetical protein